MHNSRTHTRNVHLHANIFMPTNIDENVSSSSLHAKLTKVMEKERESIEMINESSQSKDGRGRQRPEQFGTK